MIKQFACILALAASIPASAESRQVRYDDLNLSTVAGKNHLDRRISAAARAVCGGWTVRDVAPGYAVDSARCVQTAKTDAYRQLRSERVAIAAR